MTADEIIRSIRNCDRDFPPRTHRIADIAVAGNTVTIRIAPKPGFTGEPKTYSIDAADAECDEPIMLGMMRAGHFTALFPASAPAGTTAL